jgi:hypothetical protein
VRGFLHNTGIVIKSDNGSQVGRRMQYMPEKHRSSFLFETETVSNRIARIQRENYSQWQVSLRLKEGDPIRRLAIVENVEIRLIKIADKPSFMIRHRQNKTDFPDLPLNGRNRSCCKGE